MAEKESGPEKRRYPRYDVDFIVKLSVGITLSGRGHSINVSQKGIGIQAPNLFSTVKPKKLKELVGTVVSIHFPFEALTVEGQVAWIDAVHGGFGLSVFKTSDAAKWNKICRKG